MQISLHRRSRPEEFLGPFFLATAGILATGLSALHGGTGQPRTPRRPRRRRTAQILVARAILVTALVADLVARFSSNSYVFL